MINSRSIRRLLEANGIRSEITAVVADEDEGGLKGFFKVQLADGRVFTVDLVLDEVTLLRQ